ncbi:MAG TPA: hypothetical protein VKM93_12770 [Terriglobia bacterium]|nr:hypothetical protein [Terriglobia bacterium]
MLDFPLDDTITNLSLFIGEGTVGLYLNKFDGFNAAFARKAREDNVVNGLEQCPALVLFIWKSEKGRQDLLGYLSKETRFSRNSDLFGFLLFAFGSFVLSIDHSIRLRIQNAHE